MVCEDHDTYVPPLDIINRQDSFVPYLRKVKKRADDLRERNHKKK